jgi:hypothetical protein
MNRERVTSSNIASIGYDPVTNTLEVEFKNGTVYQYSDVPASVHSGLMAASSHGSYFNARIKKGPYRFRQIR